MAKVNRSRPRPGAPAGEPALEPDGDEWADDDDLLLSQDPDEASIVAAGEPA